MTSAIPLAIAITAAAYAAPPIERWLSATRHAESRGDRWAVGDHGRSRGPYQIQRHIWYSFGGRAPWIVYAHGEYESRAVARRIIAACVRACRRDGRPITYANVRYYYRNGGF